MSSKHKIDIFKVLEKLSRKDANFYRNLSDEDKKAIVPLVVMRWMSGIKDERQIVFLNELVNPFVHPFLTKGGKDYDHKELLTQLLTICGSGRSTRYHWNKAVGKRTSASPTCVSVIQEYFGYSSSDAIESLPLLSDEDIMSYAEQIGRQSDDIKILKKELKARS